MTTTRFSSKSASSHVLDAYSELKSSLCSFSPKVFFSNSKILRRDHYEWYIVDHFPCVINLSFFSARWSSEGNGIVRRAQYSSLRLPHRERNTGISIDTVLLQSIISTQDSATALAEFVHAMLTKYLANPSHMHENDRAWLLTKHVGYGRDNISESTVVHWKRWNINIFRFLSWLLWFRRRLIFCCLSNRPSHKFRLSMLLIRYLLIDH